MTRLAAFFEESKATMGATFYPKNMIFATFPSFESAKEAHRALHEAGYSDDAMLAANDAEVLAFFKEHREEKGAWGDFMRKFSRLIDTETKFADAAIERAKDGAGFLTIGCTDQEDAARIAAIVHPFSPASIEWYLPLTVQSL